MNNFTYSQIIGRHELFKRLSTQTLLTTILCLALLLATLASPTTLADTRSNAIRLFDFAEQSYPELLRPAAPEVQKIQGFYVRHYSEQNIYLGIRGDDVYVLGGPYGDQLTFVGNTSDFINLPETDISDAIFTNRLNSCSYYADHLTSAVQDIRRSILFTGSVVITVEGDQCVFNTNSIPNHDFNDTSAAFATQVSTVEAEFRIPIEPRFATANTGIALTTDNAVFLNGVKLDLLAAACFGVGNEKIGCNDMSQAWRFDPMSPLNSFGTDAHNAHTQPDGTYHYHGNPNAMFTQDNSVASPVIGFAADGFPIFGSYIEDNGSIRAVQSSFQLKSGSRPSGNGNPGGNYNGQYVDDYVYVAGSGDLDECNGMMRDGNYGYYVVDAYPWVLSCFKGTPDSSFDKGPGGPPN